MAELGNVVPTIGGGGGRSPIWWLEPGPDPAPPTPGGGDCPGGCPTVVQKPDGSTAIQMTPEQYQKALEDAAKEGAKKALDEKEAKDKAFNPADIAGKMASGCFTAGASVAAVGWVAGPVDVPATIVGCAVGGLVGAGGGIIEWALK